MYFVGVVCLWGRQLIITSLFASVAVGFFSKHVILLMVCRLYCNIQKTSSSASADDCRQAISSNTNIKWTSEERHRQGIISTDRLHWSWEDLDKLKKRPFTIIGGFNDYYWKN